MHNPFAYLTALDGAALHGVAPPYQRVATADAIRHFVRAYGDDNPLYCDAGYARSSVRGRLIAPPLFALATGTPVPADDSQPRVDMRTIPHRNTLTISGERWLLLRPIEEGLELQREDILVDVEVQDGAAQDGTNGQESCSLTERSTYSAGGTVYAMRDRRRHYQVVDRDATLPVPDGTTQYSRDEIDDLDRRYQAEGVRGSVPRTVADVKVGDRIGPMTKGPLTVTDLIEYRSGVGPGPLGAGALRLAYQNRQRHPHLYRFDENGVPDIVERRHWDEGYARSIGLPSAHDYSHTRLTWFCHMLTDWMGDGGWLWELDGTTTLGFNFVGDTHLLEGSVVEVREHAGVGSVEVDLAGCNQRGEVTCTGCATVLLPISGNVMVTDQDLRRVADEDRPLGTRMGIAEPAR